MMSSKELAFICCYRWNCHSFVAVSCWAFVLIDVAKQTNYETPSFPCDNVTFKSKVSGKNKSYCCHSSIHFKDKCFCKPGILTLSL